MGSYLVELMRQTLPSFTSHSGRQGTRKPEPAQFSPRQLRAPKNGRDIHHGLFNITLVPGQKLALGCTPNTPDIWEVDGGPLIDPPVTIQVKRHDLCFHGNGMAAYEGIEGETPVRDDLPASREILSINQGSRETTMELRPDEVVNIPFGKTLGDNLPCQLLIRRFGE